MAKPSRSNPSGSLLVLIPQLRVLTLWDGSSLTPYPAVVWTTWVYGVFSHYPSPVIKFPAPKTSLLHTHRANIQPNPAKPQCPSRIIRTPATRTKLCNTFDLSIGTFGKLKHLHRSSSTRSSLTCGNTAPPMKSCLRKPGPGDRACAARVRLEIKLCPLRRTGTAQAAALSSRKL